MSLFDDAALSKLTKLQSFCRAVLFISRETSANMGGENVSLAFKAYILLVLTVNACGYILLIRYTRDQPGPMYFSTTTVLLTECSKLCISLIILTKDHGNIMGMISDVYKNVLCNPSDSFKMCVPSLIYALQNNLAFVALSNLDAATYQVTYQMKIIATALFMVLLLGKSLSKMQWMAIFILAGGVALVQVDSASGKGGEHYNYAVGLAAISVSCLCSGFAGVYFEKVLKGSETTLWIRNVQMYLFGIVSGIFAVVTKDGSNVMEKGFLHGYTPYVFLVIAMASIGGLYTSIVVKYTDNIIKGFSTAVSIILAALGSFIIFNTHFGIYFYGGTLLVVGAIYLYSLPKPQPKITTTQAPKETV